MDAKAQISALLKQLSEGVFEKQHILAVALLSTVAGESIFLLGPPGTAKSLVARRLKLAFKDGKSFEYLMSRFSTPDEIFGPVSISLLKNEDRYERVVEGFLPTAHIVFLDEIWKASPSIQNALLTAINERIFQNGDKTLHLPMKALIAASNELPAEDEGLEALWDRFLVRMVSNCIQSETEFFKMIRQKVTTEVAIPDGVLSVVMPVFNEENTVVEIVDRVLARPEVGEVVIVNDASSDRSREKLQIFAGNSRVKLLDQAVNSGKGAALIRGFAEATKDFVIVQDADFEYDPADYPKVLAPLISGEADVVYGSRFMSTPGQVRYFRHEMGNKVLTFFSNVFSDIHLSDMESCYKAFRRPVVQNLILTSKRFGIEVEITAKIAHGRILRIWEVPISYRPRRYDAGKKISWRDGIAAFWHIVHFNCFCREASMRKKPWEEIVK